MTSLNKKIRASIFGDLSGYSMFQQMFKDKISEQRQELVERDKKITAHEKMISYLKETDELRNQLMNETSD